MRRRQFIQAGGIVALACVPGVVLGAADEAGEEADDPYVDGVDEQVVLAYGETARLSNGVEVTVHGLSFEDSFGDFTDPDGQFALLHVEATNGGDEAERFPRDRDFVLLHDGQQFDSTFVTEMDDYDEFDGGEVQPGVTREGYVVFDVPDDLAEDDLDAVWYDDFLGTNIDVRWTADAEAAVDDDATPEEEPEDAEPEEPADEEDIQYVDEVDEQVTLAYGETAHLSNGVTITAHGLHFEDELSRFAEADAGEQYALLQLTGENTSESAERLPFPWMDFALLHDGSQYDPATVLEMDDYDEFEGGEVQPGVTREGVVVFEVPDELTQDDLDTSWYDDFLGTNIDVRWTASAEEA